MASSPAYTATVNSSPVTISTANTNLDGTGTIATLVSAGASGCRVDGVIAKATGTTTAGMLRLFYNDGSTIRLIHEIEVTAVTPGASTKAFSVAERGTGLASDIFPLFLETGHSLGVATENAEEFEVLAIAGDF